jgi:glycerol-3-phosphate cytidylyltransferase-like family protein
VDTRGKIVSLAEARKFADQGATVVSGYFDPLLALHVCRLEEVKRPGTRLLVLIDNPPDAVLTARDRAELVASLRVVDRVAEGTDGLQPEIRLEDQDLQSREELIRRLQVRF